MMPDRSLRDSPLMIFIPYRLPADAEARGYARWLQEVDNPFFNTIPGIRHYANWKCGATVSGAPPDWTWFDFKGLERVEDLERVWFNADLDAFRKEWLRLWGYGADPAAPRPGYLQSSWLFERVGTPGAEPGARARVRFGSGTPPANGDIVWRLSGALPKHFAAGATPRQPGTPFVLRDLTENPLGFDWIAVEAVAMEGGPGSLVIDAERIAAPKGNLS